MIDEIPDTRAPLPDDLSLSDLDRLFGLSMRAYNVCRKNKLWSLGDIRRCSVRPEGLRHLKGCGRRTMIELEGLIQQVGHLEPGSPSRIADAVVVPPNAMLRFSEVLDRIAALYPLLSVRARNALENHLGGDSPEMILEGIVRTEFDFRKLRNIGAKTTLELEAFRTALAYHELLPVPKPAENDPLTRLYVQLSAHIAKPDLRRIVRADLIGEDGHVKPFRLLRAVVDVIHVQGNLRWKVFEAFATLPGHDGGLSDLAERLGASRERIRQVTVYFERDFRKTFGFLESIPLPAWLQGRVGSTTPALVVSDVFASEINREEGTSWTPLFIAKAMALMSAGHFKHVSWKSLGAAKVLDNSAPLLVSSSAIEGTVQAMTAIADRYNRSRTAIEVLPLRDLLPSTEESDFAVIEKALEVLIPFAFPGFSLEVGKCILPMNRRRRVEDVLAQILSDLNEPSHVDVVVQRLREVDPERDWTVEGVRSVVVRFNDRFISFGRTSTYGLRQWELEKENIKGGTIRDIAQEILQAANAPMHVNELTERIQQFRPTTNAASVRMNLQLDQDKRFSILPGGAIGLSDRVYGEGPVVNNTTATGSSDNHSATSLGSDDSGELPFEW